MSQPILKLPNLSNLDESTNSKTTELKQPRWVNQFQNYQT